MRMAGLGLAALAAWNIAAGGAWAACTPEGPAAKAFTPREFSERFAGLLALSGTLVQMDAYAAKNLRRIKPVCEVATLERGKAAYVVSGTADAALPRIMTPNDKKAPLFFLMTVPDITGVLPKSRMIASVHDANAFSASAGSSIDNASSERLMCRGIGVSLMRTPRSPTRPGPGSRTGSR